MRCQGCTLCFTRAPAINQKQFVNRPTCGRHAIVKISVLSALSEGYPGRFPSQRAGNAEPLVKHKACVEKSMLCENGDKQTLSMSPIDASATHDAVCRHGTWS